MYVKRLSVFLVLLLGLNLFCAQRQALGYESALGYELGCGQGLSRSKQNTRKHDLYASDRQAVLANFEDSQEKESIAGLLDQAEMRIATNYSGSQSVSDSYRMLKLLATAKLKVIDERKATRSILLRQVIEQLADPLLASQGSRRTCALTVLEQKGYFSEPAAVLKVILHTVQGKSVADRQSLFPDEEALVAPSVYGKRSFASQLFQIGLANMYWSKRTSDPFGRPVARGSIVYVQHVEEGLMIRDENGAMREVTDTSGRAIHHPALRLSDLNDLWSQLTDTSGQKVTLGNDAYAFNKNGESFGSSDDLARLLNQAQAEHKFPLIVAVTSESQSNKRSKNWHAALVLGFDSQSRTAIISDWYINGQRCHRAISLNVSSLFRASAPVVPVIALAR